MRLALVAFALLVVAAAAASHAIDIRLITGRAAGVSSVSPAPPVEPMTGCTLPAVLPCEL